MKLKSKYLLFGSLIIVLGIGIYLVVDTSKDENHTTADDQSKKINHIMVDADYPTYPGTKELYENASTVISGKILSYKDEVIDSDDVDSLDGLNEEKKEELEKTTTELEYLPYRIFDVEITEQFKGSYQIGDVIQVKQLYGKLDDDFYDNQGLLNSGIDYLLFLQDYPDSPSTLLNDDQSAYIIDNESDKENLQPILETEDSFDITQKEIQTISEKQ